MVRLSVAVLFAPNVQVCTIPLSGSKATEEASVITNTFSFIASSTIIVPVKVPPARGIFVESATVISAEPSKLTPFIALAVVSVAADPVVS